MKDKHIIEVLDNASIADLSASELSEVQAHARDCVSCRDAYEAAQLSGLILKSRAQVVIEPSPFFETRVMAALRERKAVESVPPMLRLWSSAKALVSCRANATNFDPCRSLRDFSQTCRESDWGIRSEHRKHQRKDGP